jgi:EmrB/QacA subfamily drug resistance transporter
MTVTKGYDTPARSGALLALFGLSSLITALDFTIVYVALPDIARDLGFSPHTLQWVVSGYTISFGGLLLLAGRLSDLLGRRRVFLAGMTLFAAGSMLGGLAPTPGLLIGARIAQGLGAAALFPSTLALVTTTFAEGPQRDRALGLWAAAGAGGLSLGALLGGVLTEAVGWPGVFFVNVPLALLGGVGAVALLGADPPRERGRGFDLPGALTGTAGAALLVFAIAQGSELGWTSAAVVLAGLAAVALIGAFIAIEAGTERPLLPLRLLRKGNLSAALGVIFVFGMTLNSIPYVLTQYFQAVLGLSALQAGLGFLVPTATITAGNVLGERLVARFGVRAVLIGGLSLGAAGALLLTPAMTADGSYLAVLPGVVGFGLGLGVVFPAMFIAASSDVPERDSGIASGLASTALQIGTAAGLAVLVGIATAGVGGERGDASRAAVADGLQSGLYVIAAGTLLAIAAAVAVAGRRAAPSPHQLPTPATRGGGRPRA